MFRDSRNELFESHFQFNTGTGLAILRRTKTKSLDSSLNIVFGPIFALLLSSSSIEKIFSYWIANYDAVKKNDFKDEKILKLTFLLVAANLRGMPPNPSTKKDTLMLRENSNSNTTNQTLN